MNKLACFGLIGLAGAASSAFAQDEVIARGVQTIAIVVDPLSGPIGGSDFEVSPEVGILEDSVTSLAEVPSITFNESVATQLSSFDQQVLPGEDVISASGDSRSIASATGLGLSGSSGTNGSSFFSLKFDAIDGSVFEIQEYSLFVDDEFDGQGPLSQPGLADAVILIRNLDTLEILFEETLSLDDSGTARRIDSDGLTQIALEAGRFEFQISAQTSGAAVGFEVEQGNVAFASFSVEARFLESGVICTADLDGDGRLSLFDFLEFQNLFDSGDAGADFDADGRLTLFDFLAFQNAFDAGCP